MSVYNGAAYLREAVNSILSQTHTDFEFLIVNDGSTDGTAEILKSFSDPRVVIIKNTVNAGLGNSLNSGIKRARGEYIIRIDADDISPPTRIEEQISFMDAHPEVSISGSLAKLIGYERRPVKKYPESHDHILCHLLFHNVLIHSSVIMRKSALVENNLYYDPSFRYSQDYELWVRASRKVKIANIPRVLILSREHKEQVGKKFWREQQRYVNLVCRRQLEELGINATEQEILLHRLIAKGVPQFRSKSRKRIHDWVDKLIRANQERKIYPPQLFASILTEYQEKTSASLGNVLGWSGRRLESLGRSFGIPL